ncbi:hypothetical protein MN608_04905 [Microdochium nivale]|nr:hypothetical protein MN608_04905 [Microdochium nivale]
MSLAALCFVNAVTIAATILPCLTFMIYLTSLVLFCFVSFRHTLGRVAQRTTARRVSPAAASPRTSPLLGLLLCIGGAARGVVVKHECHISECERHGSHQQQSVWLGDSTPSWSGTRKTC